LTAFLRGNYRIALYREDADTAVPGRKFYALKEVFPLYEKAGKRYNVVSIIACKR
jgi:hypothetical protein